LPTFLLSGFARKSVTVALSGDAGDEVFAGYPTYLAHKLARFVPGFTGKLVNPLLRLFPVSYENISLDFKIRRFLRGLPWDVAERNQVWLGAFSPNEISELLQYSTENRIPLKETLFSPLKDYAHPSTNASLVNRVLYQDMYFYLSQDIFFKADTASMLQSLEVRSPLIDHKLVEFVSGLPAKWKYHGLTSKYILKRIAGKFLPSSIINRPKKGFGIPVGKWFRNELRAEVEDVILGSNAANNLFSLPVLERLWSEHLSGKADHRKLLWPIFVFCLWHEENF
jgi:asparagine synthase (glutamine-hydrolysing)